MVWEVIHIPGHSMGGTRPYEPVGKVLSPGTWLCRLRHRPFRPFGANPAQLKDSLDRLSKLDVDILLPATTRS
jgi:glyoxylase-like metal-dependent hydrolase (beta-lactamase superfamily II)